MDERLNQWFTREILVHEPALTRFLARVWPNRAEVDDLCHDIYVRVYEAAIKAPPISPGGFLFATARHLMADRIRRGKIVSIELRGDLESLNVLIDEISPERRLSARQDLWRLAQAFAALPPRCREVMWLIKVKELTRKETAARLSITTKAVEKRIERGVRLLAEAYFSEKRLGEPQAAGSGIEGESDHG